jgi:hypothetical protein
MFGTQNMATQLLPGAHQAIFCPYYLHTGYCWYYNSCWYAYYSCGWGYYTCHFGYHSLTILQAAVQCPGGASIPAQVGPGDPVEGLRALRQQLEVTLAGVRAQEAELQRQRAAERREGT